MQKVNYSIQISASREKVWETMLNKESYLQWSAAFNPDNPGSYEGSWDQGSEIRFLGRDEDGKASGMVGFIEESRPPEFICIKYTSEIMRDVEKKYGEDQGVRESYTFNEKDGGTELLVEIDVEDKYVEMFNEMWPKALDILKSLAEK